MVAKLCTIRDEVTESFVKILSKPSRDTLCRGGVSSRRATEGELMAYASKSASELVAYIMAQFPVRLSTVFGPGKYGQRQGYLDSVGGAVPNDRALAMCVVAGQMSSSLTLEDIRSRATQHSDSDRGVRRTKTALRASSDRIRGILQGLHAMPEALIADLARGLDADSDQAEFLRSFATGSPLQAISPAAVTRHYKTFQEQLQYTSSISQTLAKKELFWAFQQKLDGLLPGRYPKTFSIVDLAAGMEVTPIDDVEQLSMGTGLYGYARTAESSARAFTVIASEPRIMLLGNPGGGKSTILAGFCAHEIREHRSAAFFVRIPEVGRAAAHRKPGTAEDAAELIVDHWVEAFDLMAEAGLRKQLVHDIVNVTDVVIAFDGLDEMASPDEHAAFRRLVHLLQNVSAKIILSSRITGYVPIMRECQTVYVEPFPEGGPSAFAREWFAAGGPDAEVALTRALRAMEHPQMANSCRTPVIAGLVCIVAETQEVRASISGLYRQYVDMHLRRAWKHDSTQRTRAADVASANKDAQDVAWAMATASTVTGGIEWLDAIALSWLVDVAGLPPRVVDLYELDGLLVGHGIAPPYDVLGQSVRWLHRTMHEHLVGWRLATEMQRDFAAGYAFLRARLTNGQWQVPIQHMSELLGEGPILRALLDSLIAEFQLVDTPSRSLLDGAAEIASSAVTQYRFAEIFGPSAHTYPHRVEPLIDAGLVSIEQYCDMLGDDLSGLISSEYSMAALISQHYPDGPTKAALLEPRGPRRTFNVRPWLQTIKTFDPDKACSLAVEETFKLSWACDEFVWQDLPTQSTKPVLHALMSTLADGSRAAFSFIQAVAYTNNSEVIAEAHRLLAAEAPKYDFFSLLLDMFCRGIAQEEFLNDVSDEQLGHVASTPWGSQIEWGVGALVAAAGRSLPRSATDWTEVGWTSVHVENQKEGDARRAGVDVEAAFRGFANKPLPREPSKCLDLYHSASWVKTGRSTLIEAQAFLEFFYSEGYKELDTYTHDIPALDSNYVHGVLFSVGPDRLVSTARQVLAGDEALCGRFSRDNAVHMLATATDYALYLYALNGVEFNPELTFPDLFVEIMGELQTMPEPVDAPIDFRFDEAMPSGIGFSFIEDAVAALPLIPNPENRQRIAVTLERLAIALGFEHRVLEILLLPSIPR
jgi:hypothetical protein